MASEIKRRGVNVDGGREERAREINRDYPINHLLTVCPPPPNDPSNNLFDQIEFEADSNMPQYIFFVTSHDSPHWTKFIRTDQLDLVATVRSAIVEYMNDFPIREAHNYMHHFKFVPKIKTRIKSLKFDLICYV